MAFLQDLTSSVTAAKLLSSKVMSTTKLLAAKIVSATKLLAPQVMPLRRQCKRVALASEVVAALASEVVAFLTSFSGYFIGVASIAGLAGGNCQE